MEKDKAPKERVLVRGQSQVRKTRQSECEI
jgi:hypothetical protein